MSEPTSRALLRHAIATLAYRAGNSLRDAPEGFATFRADPGLRTPLEILAHMGDLVVWALGFARGNPRWENRPPPVSWSVELDRFHQSLGELDTYLASDAPLSTSAERIFQGPIADALTHVGQLAILRRLAGAPVRGENYARAEIVAGRVGPEQAPPLVPFR